MSYISNQTYELYNDFQQNLTEEKQHIIETANILIYFDYKMNQLKIYVLYGTMTFLIRLYLWLMLLNLYEKTNVFSFAYLITIFFFWFRTIRFNLVKDINKAAIIILLAQYFFLLLDISENTSPLPAPSSTNLSLLQVILP